MTRINAFRNTAETSSVSWGKQTWGTKTWGKNTSALIFAAVLIVCSVTVGCSSDKPKPVSSNNQIPVTQPQSPTLAHAHASSTGRGQAGPKESRPQKGRNRELHR